eukprot:GSChrysophyteH1.ASY1.ANO1.1094.1 assembled CDS
MQDYSGAPVVLESYSDPTADLTRNLDINFENIPGATVRARFREFFRNFRQGNVFIYRDALVRQWNRREYFVDVDLAHINEYDEVLFNNLQSRPEDISHNLRHLNADLVNQLVKVPGIVISSTKSRAKATEIVMQCTKCQKIHRVPSKGPMQNVQKPAKCDNPDAQVPCGAGTLEVLPDMCKFIDQQTLKLQEAPEVVPTGEMPRNIMLSVDRNLVDRRVGNTTTPVKIPYLRVLGIHIETDGSAKDPDIYDKLARSIAPQISSDNTTDVKKALAFAKSYQMESDCVEMLTSCLRVAPIGALRLLV